jgi:symplekin
VILLGNFWDRDRSYCESVLGSLVNHILDKMQRDRGHATSMGLFYAIFSLGEPFRAIYNSLLLKLLRGMREKLPPHDTALCKLMMEVPILPQNEIVTFLRNMIIMSSDKEGEDEALEWASLGLSTLRDLVFERPSLRRSCLNLSLTCAMHKNTVLRTKATELVASTLYPVAFLQGDIEQFALKALRQLTTAGDSVSSKEVSRHMELFFALCTKKHDLLHELLSMFARASKVQKQVMNQKVSALAKEIPATSPSVLMVVESPPRGSEILLLLMLHSMAEANPLPKQLVRAVQALHRKNGDARFLVPIFADMPKADANEILHKFVELPETARKTAILNAFSKSPEGRTAGAMSASELFVGLHRIDEAKHGIPLKKMIECTNLCFQLKEIFTAKVLSIAIQQLVQYTPLPKLFMRTIIIIKKEEKLSNEWLTSMLTSIYSKLRDDNRQWQGFLMFYKGLDNAMKEKLKVFVNQK